MKNIRVISFGVGLSILLIGCNSTEVSSTSRILSKNKQKSGYFVSVFDETVDYICEDKRKKLKDSGKFECASFPIAFYMNDTRIGEISNIHEDGYVYPQDIIVLEGRAPVYTSDNSMGYLSIE